MTGKHPNTYTEWTLALVQTRAVLSVDASKIELKDAIALVRKISSDTDGVLLKFYNCGSIPWNLLQVAELGGRNVEFVM